MRASSESNERFFGFGEQLTYFDQKGKVIPILMQEHDIGRGLPGFTQLVNLTGNGGRDNPYVTKAPYYTNSCLYKYTFHLAKILKVEFTVR